MRDPNPENIDGEKIQRHVFKHEINWGHVAIAVAAVFVAFLLFKSVFGPASGDESAPESDENLIA